jgi:hypothetical protein
VEVGHGAAGPAAGAAHPLDVFPTGAIGAGLDLGHGVHFEPRSNSAGNQLPPEHVDYADRTELDPTMEGGALIRLRNNTTNSRPDEWGGGEALELDSEQSQPREQTAQAIAGWLPTREGRDRARCGARGRISAPRQSSPVAARGAAWEEAKGDAPPRRKAAWFSVQPFAGGEVADDRFWRRRISGEREGQSEREREREEGNPPPEFAVFRYHPCVHGGTARRLG